MIRLRKKLVPAGEADSIPIPADVSIQRRFKGETKSPTPAAPLSDRFILGLVWQQRSLILPALLALAFCVLATLASPVLSGALIESLMQGRTLAEYGRLLALLGVLHTVEAILSRAYVVAMCRAGEGVQAVLRQETFRLLLAQQMEFYDRHRSAELTSLLSRELEALRLFVFGNVCGNRGLRGVAEALGAVLVLFWLSWRLAPILAGVIISGVAAAQLYRRQTQAAEAEHAAAQMAAAQAASESFSNIRTVRIFAGETLEIERFGRCVAAAHSSGIGLAHARGLLECVNRGAVHASLLALYALGGYLVSSGLMPLRTLVSAMSFTWALAYSSQGVVQTFADCRHALASLRRVQSVLSELPPDPNVTSSPLQCSSSTWLGQESKGRGWKGQRDELWWGGTVAAPRSSSSSSSSTTTTTTTNGRHSGTNCSLIDGRSSKGSPPGKGGSSGGASRGGEEGGECGAVAAARGGDLELRGCCFAYPTRSAVPVLQEVSLRLQRGRVTALVGRSGAGKTTVASLLQRLYAPTKGGIFLGDRDIQEFDRLDWVAALTSVSQEPILFSGTVAENIGYGKGMRCSQEEIERAAQAANAHDFITGLPEGYGTLVGERGGLLSGGQRQRIALARALLKDSPILILDEATSALDSQSERLVQQAIDKLVEGRTVLVIAHRLSTVQSADQIAVLEGGRVEELGTHKELVKRRGMYSHLVSSQALAAQ